MIHRTILKLPIKGRLSIKRYGTYGILKPMQELLNFIDNRFTPSAHGPSLPIHNPATGEVLMKVANSGPQEVERAVLAAQKAAPLWAQTSAEERGKKLRAWSELIVKNLNQLAEMETANTGKPLSTSLQVDIPRAAKNLAFFADLATQFSSESHTSPEAMNLTLRTPLGVVATISPWNLPLYLLTWKIAPALACGNTVVAKPSEITPLTAHRLAELALEAGLPAGVFNIVHGDGKNAGEALIQHPGVKAVSFTGGTVTGQRIAQVCAQQLKKVSLELGGKNPTLIFADAHFEEALEMSVRAAFSNQGQICLCGSRLLIEESLYPKFREAFVQKVAALKVGDPLDAQTQVGAVISATHLQKIAQKVAEAKNLGGKILCGGEIKKVAGRCLGGYFYAPTVIEGLDGQCLTNQEEIFGPVVTLLPFKTESEALELANGTPYGLSASVWTQNVDRALRMGQKIEAGMVWINTWMLRDLRTPFGGVKNSGMGREGGIEAMRFFTEAKNLCFKIS